MIKSLFKNVVVVVNSSESSISAVKYAVILAKTYKCNVKAVYVVDTATLKQLTLSKFFLHEESLEYETNLVTDGERYLKYAQELGLAKGITIQTELRKGAIWSEITACADDFDAQLVLLGGYEKEGTGLKDVISSSYRKILANVHCPVLVVKGNDIETLYKMA
ncbi:MAG: universal stress protein [Spirochaetaceae bacterium]|nr:universal stress protein [Spirochaetaceae bacterium]MBO7486644.1 universal stress protein [Spirochaetaceae bacterium]